MIETFWAWVFLPLFPILLIFAIALIWEHFHRYDN